MHAAIYRYQIDQRANEVVQFGQKEFIPLLKKMPGFIAHYVAELGSQEAVMVAIFETEGQLRKFHDVATDWVQNKAAPQFGEIYGKPVEEIFGRVTARNTPHEQFIDAGPVI